MDKLQTRSGGTRLCRLTSACMLGGLRANASPPVHFSVFCFSGLQTPVHAAEFSALQFNPHPAIPEFFLIKTHRTRKFLRNGIAGRRGSPGSSFRSHGSPRVVKNCPISICGCKSPPSGCGASRFYFDVSRDAAMLPHIFDGQIARLGPFEKLPQRPAIPFRGVIDKNFNLNPPRAAGDGRRP